jgi:hypothetical protein
VSPESAKRTRRAGLEQNLHAGSARFFEDTAPAPAEEEEKSEPEEFRAAKYVKIFSKSYCTTNYGCYIHRSVWPERDTGQHNPQSRELTTLRVQE